MPNIVKILLSILAILPCLNAWKVDSSCSGGDADFVTEAVNEAFSMAAQTLTELQRTPRDPDVDRLIGLLFCKPDQTPDTLDLNSLRSTYQSLVDHSRPTQGRSSTTDVNANQDVVFYCNTHRFQKRDDGFWYDSVSGVANIEDATCSPTDLAFTHAIGTIDVEEQPMSYNPSQVTICPWFLQWQHKQRYNTWAQVKEGKTKAYAVSHGVGFMVEKVWPRWAEIDSERLFDVTILHELTHTYTGNLKSDVIVPKGPSGRKSGYGWKTCLELAKSGSGSALGPLDNADSLALFSMAIRLLRNTPSEFVNADGKKTTTRPSKRDVPVELQYRRTPAAFEGFLTVIKENAALATVRPRASADSGQWIGPTSASNNREDS